ncbi:unnamed protein product [Caenorhabditis auriculariae]|uniref:ADF-H domain-containing protein n=1 Tax=Caenorhabditis auriculariae TaxID=2777116 RepID=A0A8S1HU50_9PELO|nr:unnamed protein product [Caenorhabditis auriculariae]
MSGTLAICSVPDEVKEKLRDFRFAKSSSMNALIVKVQKETQEFAVEEEYLDSNLDEIRDELPAQQPRFLLLSWCRKHDDGRQSFPLLLVYYCPNGCSPDLQMLYAGSRNHLIKECDLTKTIELRDLDDLTDEFIVSKLA